MKLAFDIWDLSRWMAMFFVVFFPLPQLASCTVFRELFSFFPRELVFTSAPETSNSKTLSKGHVKQYLLMSSHYWMSTMKLSQFLPAWGQQSRIILGQMEKFLLVKTTYNTTSLAEKRRPLVAKHPGTHSVWRTTLPNSHWACKRFWIFCFSFVCMF